MAGEPWLADSDSYYSCFRDSQASGNAFQVRPSHNASSTRLTIIFFGTYQLYILYYFINIITITITSWSL